MKPIVNLLLASEDAVNLVNFVTLTGVVLFIVFLIVLALKASVRADPQLSDAFAHWSQDELRLALEVLNPSPEQKRAVEAAWSRFDQQVLETIQRQAELWALDYFERTHRVIISVFQGFPLAPSGIACHTRL